MNSQKGYVINVVVTGFMVVVVLSTVLFAARFFCLQGLLSLMPDKMLQAEKSPSGLLGEWDRRPDRPVTEPNAVAKPSQITCSTSSGLVAQGLGIFQYIDHYLSNISRGRSDQSSLGGCLRANRHYRRTSRSVR